MCGSVPRARHHGNGPTGRRPNCGRSFHRSQRFPARDSSGRRRGAWSGQVLPASRWSRCGSEGKPSAKHESAQCRLPSLQSDIRRPVPSEGLRRNQTLPRRHATTASGDISRDSSDGPRRRLPRPVAPCYAAGVEKRVGDRHSPACRRFSAASPFFGERPARGGEWQPASSWGRGGRRGCLRGGGAGMFRP